MRTLLWLAGATAALAAGCSFGLNDSTEPHCRAVVQYSPDPLIASLTQTIRASAQVAGEFSGVASYRWSLARGPLPVTFTPASADLSQIDFSAVDAGIYTVRVEVPGCDLYDAEVNVLSPEATPRSFRLRVTPPAGSSIPPQDREIVIPSGADFAYGPLLVEPFMRRPGVVKVDATPVPAYLQFSPASGSGEVVAEATASASGAFEVAVANGRHDVLVVPLGDRAPFRVTDWLSLSADISGPAGEVLRGSVRGPDDQPVAGARVSVKRDGVPSSVGLSDASGAFAVRLQASAAAATVSVVPPQASGLPRLDGTLPTLATDQPLAIRYRADLALRDVAGVELRRQGQPAAFAQAIFVGAVAAAGSAGASALDGQVRVAVTAGADGKLPTAKVPAAALSAVVVPAAGEQAVLPFDGAAPPALLDAPAMRAVTGTARTPAGASAPGAVIDLLPSGALALAGAAGRTAVADGAGAFSVPAAFGGSYRLEISDPQQRGAPSLAAVAAPGAIGAVSLQSGHRLQGKILPLFSASPLVGAAVEMFCVVCSDADKRRPLATAITGFDGGFALLVPDDAPPLP